MSRAARPAGRSRGAARGWDVFRALTVAEMQDGRDFTVVGVVKWVLEPLSYMVVYFVLVASILGRSRGEDFPLFLLSALVPWRYFTGVMQGSMGLVTRFSSVIANVPVPTGVLPLVVMATEGANLLVAMVLFLPMMVVSDVGSWSQLVWTPVLLANLALLTAGPAYLMTVAGLYLADFRGIIQNTIRAGFFISTALIPLKKVPGEQLPLLLQANPLSGIFDSFRAVFLGGRKPGAFDVFYPAAVGLVLLVLGVALYRWRRHRIPKEV